MRVGDTMNLLEIVRDFQLASKQPIPAAPVVDNRDLNELCVSLLDEEVSEVEMALAERDVPGVLKELIDVIYIALGNVEQLGYGPVFHEAFWRVHVSNMAKVVDGVHMNAAGKITKPPGWIAPDIASLVASHQAATTDDSTCTCNPPCGIAPGVDFDNEPTIVRQRLDINADGAFDVSDVEGGTL